MKNKISPKEIRSQLERVVHSPEFSASHRLCRFLRFVVGAQMEGRGDALKESLIGTEVYDRPVGYDPSQNSIVRTESGRLRGKLAAYYEGTGRSDPITISLRPGSYVPHFETRQVAAEGAAPPESVSLPEASVSGVYIALLPFVDPSGESATTALARDLTDEMAHEMMRTPGLRVAAASAVASVDCHAIPELVNQLGVQLVLEGSLKKDNDRIRVISRLVNADGFQVCSQRLEARANTRGEFPIAQLASTLVSRIRPEQSMIHKLSGTVTRSLLQHFSYLIEAETLLDDGTPSDIRHAQAKLQEIAQVLPDFARPHCGIAQGHAEIALRGGRDSVRAVAAAREAAEKAYRVDPDMIPARVAMGVVETLAWNWPQAEVHFQAALNLGVNAGAYRQYGLYSTARGQFDEAFHYLQRAQQIDPFCARQKVALARFFFLSGRAEEANEDFSDRSEFGAVPFGARVTLALLHSQCGQSGKAVQAARDLRRNAGGQPGQMASIAEILAVNGEQEEADRIVRDLSLLHPTASPVSYFRQALLHLSRSEIEPAVSRLNEACQQCEPEMIWLKVDPRFSPLKARPEYSGLLEMVFRQNSESLEQSRVSQREQPRAGERISCESRRLPQS